MKQLLNTLYILTPYSSLSCKNQSIRVSMGGEEKISVAANTIDAIVCFGTMSVSTPLIDFCCKRGITIVFLSEYGRFIARVEGPVSGNVLLRKKQYDSLSDTVFCNEVRRNILAAKITNCKNILVRAGRENPETKEAFTDAARALKEFLPSLKQEDDVNVMRGIEGKAAVNYFQMFDNMLHSEKTGFFFDTRSKRPPQNEVNATLSFVYTLLSREEQSALESVGLDPAVGYIHALRPGRASFALDLMEELRAPLCDRFVISLFNLKRLQKCHFDARVGSVYLNEQGKKIVLADWQNRKQESIVHPFLEEKIPIGLIPYTQALLFARTLRGDIDVYPPFIWR